MTAFALGSLIAGPAPAATNQEPPTVVVFLVDDMGVMDTPVPFPTDHDVKPRGHPLNDFYRTPNMKRFADKETRVPFIAAWAKADPDKTNQQRLPIPTGTCSRGSRFPIESRPS
ncbi:hypothetical protein Pan216_42930 [Planctomycetes bacterium Pan216]|uniref:Sulfatase n=1 Tax=Kolteria novifilia TaxID=2527975 RepID=A0A518B8X2_9BACT|nr:hypothetical protein Pan216_42930 [Planctomycetes bacterium Pan216]